MVGVWATLFCVEVDMVFDMMPAVVWALTDWWVWLGVNTRLLASLVSAEPAVTKHTYARDFMLKTV